MSFEFSGLLLTCMCTAWYTVECRCMRYMQIATLSSKLAIGSFTTSCTETSRCVRYRMLWCCYFVPAMSCEGAYIRCDLHGVAVDGV